MKSGNFEARFRLAQALARLGDTSKALPHFELAYKAQPKHVRNLSEYAKCLVAEGQHKEALRLWRRAVKGEPSDVDLRIGYVSLLAEMGRADDAKGAAAETFDLIIEPNRNALLLARILSELRSLGHIVAALGRICRRDQSGPLERDQIELIARYAIALDLEARPYEAQDWLKYADENGACQRLVVRNLVRVLANLDQIDAAEQVIERMLAREASEK
jgi:Flp pilus assembly protein TadD